MSTGGAVRTGSLLCLLLLLGAGAARSEQETPARAAAAVREAFLAGRGLGEVAARPDPDPWLVVDVLCASGDLEAAKAYAAAVRGPDVEGLVSYLSTWVPAPEATAVRVALAKAENALGAKDPEAALGALGERRGRTGTVLAVRLLDMRGQAHSACRRQRESAAAFGAAARSAEEIGWLRRAAAAYTDAMTAAHARSDLRGALGWCEHRVRIELRRGNLLGQGAALGTLGGLQESTEAFREGLVSLKRALAILEPLARTSREAAANRGATLVNLARIHQGLGDYTRAIEVGEEALRRLEELGHQGFAAWALANLGEVELNRGESRRAHRRLEQALEAMRQTRDRAGEARVQALRGRCFTTMQRTAEAREALEAARSIGEKTGARWVLAHALRGLGVLAMRQGPYSEAVARFEQALELYRAIGDRRSEVWLLSDLARTRSLLGEVASARQTHRKAIELAERLGYRHGLAGALCGVGDGHEQRGEYADARAALERAREIYDRLGDRAGVADVLNGLGVVHWRQANYTDARSSLDRALAIHREIGSEGGIVEVLGNVSLVLIGSGCYEEAAGALTQCLEINRRTGDRAGESRNLVGLGICHHQLGNLARALTLWERALGIARRTEDRRLLADLLTNLGQIHGRIGEAERARVLLDEALELRRRLGDRSGAAKTRAVLGTLAWSAGAIEAARSHLERSWRELTVTEAWVDAAAAQSDLGVVLCGLGRYEEAGRRFRAAAAIQRARDDRVGVVRSELNLALLLLWGGKPESAVDGLRRVCADAERLGQRSIHARGRAALAEAELMRGQPEAALAAARRAVELSRELAQGFGDEPGASLRANLARRLRAHEVGARAARILGRPEDLLYFLETGRAGAFLEAFGGRNGIVAAAIPAELRAEEEAARAAEETALERHRSALEAGKEVEARREELDAARDRVRLLIQRIQRVIKAAVARTHPEPDSLDEIRSCLEKDEVLVLYGLFADEAVALVVASGEARIVPLVEPSRIVASSRRLLLAGRRGSGGMSLPSEEGFAADPTRAAAELRGLVVDPLNLPRDTRSVLVSPDGVLSDVPFSVLLGDVEIVHVPSGTVLGLLAGEKAKRGEGVLALGDPRGTRDGRKLASLPATRAEAEAAGDVVLLGPEATETALWRALAGRPRWRGLHFAGHSLVDPVHPTLSALALSPDAASDGRLGCLEIFGRRVPADLVVLSACETAKGRVYQAEGVLGLTRAFLFAGSPRVLCSLWKVDDEATGALMVKFYELWREGGLSAAAALKGAQAHVRSHERWRKPYFWAGWVLWGVGD